MKILVIGGGWYGCHLSSFLIENNFEITIVDKENELFSGSSLKNQNRLHLGFHYPRSDETIIECKNGYKEFIKKYNHLCVDLQTNLYFIALEMSKITIDFFINKMKKFGLEFSEYKERLPIEINKIEKQVIKVNEKYINPFLTSKYFKDLLNPYLKKLKNFDSIDDILNQLDDQYNLIINCTFNQLNPIDFCHYEFFVTLLYKIDTENIFAYTIMDGPFFSIFPYNLKEKIYTVTSVIHGVAYRGKIAEYDLNENKLQEIKKNITFQILEFIPFWNEIATYQGYFTSWKTKFYSETDNRSLQYHFDGKVLNYYGGKITGIFEAEKILRSVLKV